jgi:hypothetical protein
MSLWRAKRRHEANRRFSERADRALLAIALLQAETELASAPYDEADVRTMLSEGRQLLSELEQALETPASVDDYHYNLAQDLVEQWKKHPEDVVDRLRNERSTLEEVERQLTVTEDIEDVEETLETVETLASQTSEAESRRIRSHLAN